MPPKDFPSAHYDSWKTTDPTWESSDDRAPCAYWHKKPCDGGCIGTTEEGTAKNGWHFTGQCNIPYEDHDDESIGHIFVMPEPEQRDY